MQAYEPFSHKSATGTYLLCYLIGRVRISLILLIPKSLKSRYSQCNSLALSKPLFLSESALSASLSLFKSETATSNNILSICAPQMANVTTSRSKW